MPVDVTRNRRRVQQVLFWGMLLLSVGIGLHALGFQLRLSGAANFHAHFDTLPWSGGAHVLAGAVVLLLGGFQFWGALRRRLPAVHRAMGRIYLLAVLAGGLAGLWLAPRSSGGLVAHAGFGLLALLWLGSGWLAYNAIRTGDVAAHRKWMLRNYALSFGAVTLRLYLGLMLMAGVPFQEAYPAVAWLSWVINLVLVEWYLLPDRPRQLQPGPL